MLFYSWFNVTLEANRNMDLTEHCLYLHISELYIVLCKGILLCMYLTKEVTIVTKIECYYDTFFVPNASRGENLLSIASNGAYHDFFSIGFIQNQQKRHLYAPV